MKNINMEAREPITKAQKDTLRTKSHNLLWFIDEPGINKEVLNRLCEWLTKVEDKTTASAILSAYNACYLPNSPMHQRSLTNLAAFISICKAYKEVYGNLQMPKQTMSESSP